MITTASTGAGVPELLAALDRHRPVAGSTDREARRSRAEALVWAVVGDRLRDELLGALRLDGTAATLDAVADHSLDPYAAADRLLASLRAATPTDAVSEASAGRSPIRHVLVAGAGLMGHGIAQVHAAVGTSVLLYEPDLSRAVAGRDRIAANLDRAVAKGRLGAEEREATMARIVATADTSLVGEADLVIEAVFEDFAVKSALWSELDRRARPDAVFATNTSSIPIDSLATAVSAGRRERFLGMHFFSPVPVMPLVELIRGSATADAAEALVRADAAGLGKQVIASADRPGFIVNRILMPFLAEAMRAYEEGVGTAEDIDTGARIGLNHPMGPLALADFIGLDVCLGILRVLHEGLGQEHLRPPRVLEELVAAGHLGQKSGRGFFVYGEDRR